ncbi:MarR family winged helix-turn-helix transcriptional regulator [Prauserella flavalba]|uniref:MarR family transcriptional regulator n=1 Tax=Prauserella flavalba TaxID=1477506 RepID=A0A318LTX2_9PSEU|nr:MarR family transcriptional regulator [Prauserella flavalba]PXY38204.1 MarR family transcriptional regulator [Prauserella flavalba]
MTAAHSPGDDVLVRLLRQLTVENGEFVEILRQAHRMHRTDLNALAVIMEATRSGGPPSPRELAEALHLSASATTALIDRLESAGHVHRTRSATDRRRVELRVEETALELARSLFTPLGEELSRTWTEFGPEERRIIERFLTVSIDATVRTKKAVLPPGRPRSGGPQ